jgi:hypothetical protein
MQLKRDRGGGSGSRKRTHSECESEPWQHNRQTECARNWAEQRRDQLQPRPQFYRGSGNPPEAGGTTRVGDGGGEDRSFPTYGGGRRPYNRGWVPRSKHRN